VKLNLFYDGFTAYKLPFPVKLNIRPNNRCLGLFLSLE